MNEKCQNNKESIFLKLSFYKLDAGNLSLYYIADYFHLQAEG